MMKRIEMNRRQFLAATAATTATACTTTAPQPASRTVQGTASTAKLNIAGIGVGGMGANNLRAIADENIVALCDVDHAYAAKTFAEYPKAKLYKDYRVMFEKQKDLDAVIIATPDHTHASITKAAMEAGLHVYCQKPLTHDIYESRVIAQEARQRGVVTQMGIQGHSGEGPNLISEWIWDGAIGDVEEVVAWCAVTYYPFGHVWWSSKYSDRPADTPEAPEGMNWDLWLGPAPLRPYHPTYHPSVWRCWWDFGCGWMGDRGVHTFDPIFTAMKLGHPDSVEATTMGGNDETHPLVSIVTFRFPQRGNLKPLKLTWYEGLEPPRLPELEEGRRLPDEGGMFFKGTQGTIMAGIYGDGPRLIPESAMKDYKRPAKTIPRVVGTHEQDWIRVCKEGGQTGANFDYSGTLSEVAHLGNVAKRCPGQVLKWDGANMKVTNVPEANKWIKGPRRAGWEL